MVMKKCGTIEEVSLFNEMLLPYPGDCTRFCRCDGVKAYHIPCPAGLHFNADVQSCDHPQTARCTVTRTINYFYQ